MMNTSGEQITWVSFRKINQRLYGMVNLHFLIFKKKNYEAAIWSALPICDFSIKRGVLGGSYLSKKWSLIESWNMKVLTCSLPGFSGKETHSIQEMLKRPPVVAETKVFLLTKIRYVRVSHFWNVFFLYQFQKFWRIQENFSSMLYPSYWRQNIDGSYWCWSKVDGTAKVKNLQLGI